MFSFLVHYFNAWQQRGRDEIGKNILLRIAQTLDNLFLHVYTY